MSKTKSSAIQKVDDTTKALALFEGDAGEGFENTTGADFALPFLKLLQKGSPEVDRDKGEYIDGALPGMYVDTATKEIFETFKFVPCFYHRAMVEWGSIESGGGFIAQHPVGHEEKFKKDERGRWLTSDDGSTYLADTRYFFGLRIREGGGATPAVVSMASTQIKKARSWMTQLADLKFEDGPNAGKSLPIFAAVWEFSSVPESKDEFTWRGYKIENVGLIEDAALASAARDARKMFSASATNLREPGDGTQQRSSDTAGADVPF